MKKSEYDLLKKQVNKTNQKIKEIEKKYGKKSWAINYLYEKLDTNLVQGISKYGRVRLNKKMSEGQIQAIKKSIENFSKSSTSKVTGIEKAIRKTKSSLKATLGDMESPISNREIEKLYGLLEDKETRDLTEKIGASTLWVATKEAKDRNLTFERYVSNVNKRSELDLKEKEDIIFLRDVFEDYTGRSVSDSEISEIFNNLKL